MKPQNDKQRHILNLYHRLPSEPSPSQMRWAIKTCHSHTAMLTGQTKRCTCCGHRFANGRTAGQKTRCPKCGCTLEVKDCKTQSTQENWWFTVCTTIGGYQVVRNYIIKRKLTKDAIEYSVYEATCSFIDAAGGETCIGRRRCSYFWNSYWVEESDMEIRKISANPYHGNYNDYHINADVYPQSRFLPILRRNGITLECQTMAISTLCVQLLKDWHYEMLIKNRQYQMIRRAWLVGGVEHPDIVRICNRHRYVIEHPDLWCDCISALEFIGCDIHNPKFACPQDLNAMHDWAVGKRKKKQAEIDRLKRLEEIASEEPAYAKSKGMYFGICFGRGDIMVAVISSVAEMEQEGTDMHHCVFANEYYKKDHSLILSAKDADGNRIETIEVSLKDYTIVQSRGRCNQNTDRHQEILDIVNQNMKLIKNPQLKLNKAV